jgi:hypothetical protein
VLWALPLSLLLCLSLKRLKLIRNAVVVEEVLAMLLLLKDLKLLVLTLL